MKFECIVRYGKTITKIVRYFTSIEYAFAWLELEGYKIISIKVLI